MGTRNVLNPILVTAAMLVGTAASGTTVLDTLEDIGADGTPVTTRVIGGVVVDLSTSGAVDLGARTYLDNSPAAFGGPNLDANRPLRPSNVSGTRFISTVVGATTGSANVGYGFDKVQPLVFHFASAVTGFGFTTLDLLENAVPNGSYLTVEAFDSSGEVVAEQTRTGPQGASGVDLDWYLSTGLPEITQVQLSGVLSTGNGYGIDDLVVDVPLLSPTHAESTFDTTSEGWWFHQDGAFSWDSFGNPGGSIRIVDQERGTLHGFTASSAFLGDKSAAFGGTLQWDIYVTAVGDASDNEPDLVLQSHELTLVLELPSPIPNQWNRYTVDLDPSAGWKLGSLTGVAATDAEMVGVLSELTALRIRGEYATGAADTAYLDNARITERAWYGECLQTPASHRLAIEQGMQGILAVELSNPGAEACSASLEFVNPYADFVVIPPAETTITLAPGETTTFTLTIDTGSAAVGTYEDILLELALDNGNTLTPNITLYVTEGGAADLPDLTVNADDLNSTLGAAGDPVTLTAVVHNKGTSPASNAVVRYYEFGILLGEAAIAEIPANASVSSSISVFMADTGDHLVDVVVDPDGVIEELDELNNEASLIVQLNSTLQCKGVFRPPTACL